MKKKIIRGIIITIVCYLYVMFLGHGLISEVDSFQDALIHPFLNIVFIVSSIFLNTMFIIYLPKDDIKSEESESRIITISRQNFDIGKKDCIQLDNVFYLRKDRVENLMNKWTVHLFEKGLIKVVEGKEEELRRIGIEWKSGKN